MQITRLSVLGLLIVTSASLAACAGSNVKSIVPPPAQNTSPASSAEMVANSALEAQVVDGGSVTVKVTPLKTGTNAPLEFEIVMDTHSVELVDDMLETVVLRDDAGNEYTPLKWVGPGAGGHHRQGTIQFAPLEQNTKTLTLLVKDVAGVPERVFEWELAQ